MSKNCDISKKCQKQSTLFVENMVSRLREIETGDVKSTRRHSQQFCSSESLVRRFQLTKQLSFHEGCVNALSFNRSGSLLLSGSDDLKVCIWDWVQAKPACFFDSLHKSNVFQCRFMPFANDCTIVTSGLDGQVRSTQLDPSGAYRSSSRILKHTGSCHNIILDEQNPDCVISCGEDGRIRLVDTRTPAEALRSIVVTNESRQAISLYSIAMRPMKPNELAACGIDRHIRIFDYRFTTPTCGTLVKKFSPYSLEDTLSSSGIFPHITSVAYSRDGRDLIASYHNDGIFLFDADHSDEADSIHRYKGHSNYNTVKGVNFYGSNSEYVISGSDCGRVFIWRKDTEEIVWYASADEAGPVNVIEPHPSFPVIATSGFESVAKIWEPTRSEPVSLDDLESVIERNRAKCLFFEDTDFLLRAIRTFHHYEPNTRMWRTLLIPMNSTSRSIILPPEVNINYRSTGSDLDSVGQPNHSSRESSYEPGALNNDDSSDGMSLDDANMVAFRRRAATRSSANHREADDQAETQSDISRHISPNGETLVDQVLSDAHLVRQVVEPVNDLVESTDVELSDTSSDSASSNSAISLERTHFVLRLGSAGSEIISSPSISETSSGSESNDNFDDTMDVD